MPGTLQTLIAAEPGANADLCRKIAPGFKLAQAKLAFSIADVGLCASGTATLEAACAGVPSVVFYRLAPISYQIARRLIKVPYVALPNLILGRQVFPEFIQDDMDPHHLADEVFRLLDFEQQKKIKKDLALVVKKLGEPGYAERVAHMALKLMSL